jgi:putative phage-type endonuclease
MTIHHPKSREEWLALRHKYVSSTESSALHGLSPYITAFELYHNKKHASAVPFEMNERVEWGVRLEETIARGIADRYGVSVRKLSAYVSRDGTGMGSSFDYEIVGVKEGEPPEGTVLQEAYRSMGPGILEIKNVDWLVYRDQWDEDEAPPHIEIQVQHQLHVIQRKWSAMGVLVGGNDLKLIVREYDADIGSSLQEKVHKFWKDCAAGTPPPVTLPEDADIIAHIYSFGDPEKVLDAQGNEEVRALCAEYAEAGRIEREAEDRKKTAKSKLLMLIGDASKVMSDGFTISAGTVAAGEVKAYYREAYRGFRVYVKKVKETK